MLLSASLLMILTQRVRRLSFRLQFDRVKFSRLFSTERIDGHFVYRIRSGVFLAAQVLGALTGAAAICAATRLGPLGAAHWLSASPTLLVNDVVAGAAILLLVWALARELDTRLLLLALVLMTAYRVTDGRWHVLGAPRAFVVTVQRALLVQFAAIALVLIHARARST